MNDLKKDAIKISNLFLLLALVLFSILIFEKSPLLKRSYIQISNINQYFEHVNSEFLYTKLNEKFKEVQENYSYGDIVFRFSDKNYYIKVNPNGKNFILKDNSYDSSMYLDFNKITFRQLQVLWDSLFIENEICFVKPYSYLAHFNRDLEEYEFSDTAPEKKGEAASLLRFDIIDISDTEWIKSLEEKRVIQENSITPFIEEKLLKMVNNPNVNAKYYLVGSFDPISSSGFIFSPWNTSSVTSTDNFKEVSDQDQLDLLDNLVFIPVSLHNYEINLLDIFIEDERNIYNWTSNSFKTLFSELYEIGVKVDYLDLESMKSFIRNQIEENLGYLQIFGIKIPVTTVNYFGIVFYLMLQIYLIQIHLQILKCATNENYNELCTWLPFYYDNKALYFYVFNYFILPVFLLTYLGIQLLIQEFHFYHLTFLIIIMLLNYLIIYKNIKIIQLIRKKIIQFDIERSI